MEDSIPERIHMLVTDVVLPDVNDRVLARHGVPDPEIEFLAKPYSSDALASRVRDIFDRARA